MAHPQPNYEGAAYLRAHLPEVAAEIAQGMIDASLWLDASPLALQEDPHGSVETGNLAKLTANDQARRHYELWAAAFLIANVDDAANYADHRLHAAAAEGSIWEHFGHDLWLSAGEHGAGFFDRDYTGPQGLGERLQVAAGAAAFQSMGDYLALYETPDRKHATL